MPSTAIRTLTAPLPLPVNCYVAVRQVKCLDLCVQVGMRKRSCSVLSRRCTAQACRPHGPLTQAGLLLLRYTDRLLALAADARVRCSLPLYPAPFAVP